MSDWEVRIIWTGGERLDHSSIYNPRYNQFKEEDRRRLAEVMKDALPGDVISSCDTFPASYVNRSKLEREK